MKLYNRTKCPDSILGPLLAAAGRAVGARTSGVIVKITQGRRSRVSGIAWRCDWWQVDGKRRIRTDRAAFKLVLQAAHPCYDATILADQFYSVACHEWRHIADIQAGPSAGAFEHYRDDGSRLRHGDRPQEIRARNAAKDAVYAEKLGEIKSRDPERSALTVWFRSQQKGTQ